jgi:uncharacterized protein
VKNIPKLTAASLVLALALGCSGGQASSSQSSSQAVSGPAVELAGRVTDAAQLLTEEQETGLSAKLEKLERATKHQMVVVTVPTLRGQDIAEFTKNLGNSWGIGRKGHDDGVIMLVAPNERKVRIAVGDGLAKELPDALCKQILDEQVLPRFRMGDFPGGMEAGLDALVAKLSD